MTSPPYGDDLAMATKIPAGIGALAHDSGVRAIPHQYFHASYIGATREYINVTQSVGAEPEDRVFLIRAPILQTEYNKTRDNIYFMVAGDELC